MFSPLLQTDLKKDRLLRLPQGDDELLSFAEEMKGKFEVCAGIREDYFECLHGTKERARLQKIMLEQQRQKDTAAH